MSKRTTREKSASNRPLRGGPCLVNQWVQLQRELLNESIQIMNLSNPESAIIGEMKENAKKAEAVFDSILKQMRRELDISS